MLEKFFILAAILAFAFGCRTFANRWLQKLVFISYLSASYLVGLWLTGSHIGGAVAVSFWFLLPWLEIGRVRTLRFDSAQQLKNRFAPSRQVFPELPELTEEAEAQGFEEKDDVGWSWEETEHFMRLMSHAEARTRVALAQASHDEFFVSYVNVSSRVRDGRTFTTTNYPFPMSMKSAPRFELNRYTDAESLESLLQRHDEFLKDHAVMEEDLLCWEEESFATDLSREMQEQVDHNLAVGVLEPVEEGKVRYSWRGCFFLWGQVLKDMIRI
jgi:hypothetical protein